MHRVPKTRPQPASSTAGGQQQPPQEGEGSPKAIPMATCSCVAGDSLWVAWKSKRQRSGVQTTVSQSPFSEKRARRWSREQGHLGKAGNNPLIPLGCSGEAHLAARRVKPKQPPTPSRPGELAGPIPSSSGEKPQILAPGTLSSYPCFVTLLSQGDSGGVGRAGSA